VGVWQKAGAIPMLKYLVAQTERSLTSTASAANFDQYALVGSYTLSHTDARTRAGSAWVPPGPVSEALPETAPWGASFGSLCRRPPWRPNRVGPEQRELQLSDDPDLGPGPSHRVRTTGRDSASF
jgi:hypothetical protein